MILIPTLAALLLAPVQGKLVIKDLVKGTGPVAMAGDAVTVDYKGMLMSGKVFDASTGKSPFRFTLGAGQVIKGWDQGVAGMKVGGKRVLTIPPALAYGAEGAGGVIPPNATLKFEVKVLEVRKKGSKPKIQIKELKAGKGKAAKEGDNVVVHYKGMFLNGLVFDTSVGKTPLPVQIGMGGVIPGFDQALKGMKVGQKRRVTIPYELAYGEAGRDPIPPYATLVFELEMVKVGK